MGVALEQEHNIIGLLHGVTGTYISFDQEFVKYPYISVILSGTNRNSANVNSFIRNVSVAGFDIEFSDAFTGYVHYIAARRM